MQGDLTQQTLADVIRSLYVGRRSGILHLALNDITKRIMFRKGSMIFANSDVDSDRLGEFLIRQGTIDREAFQKASDIMKENRKRKETRKRFGKTVVELGFSTAEEMQASVVAQIQAIIYSLFAWEAGTYKFEQHENPVDEDIVLNLSTADIILEGIRRMADVESIHRAMGDTGRVLQHSENPLLLYQKISLNPSEGFVLSRVDGMSTVTDIAAISPLGEDETLRCVYGLVSAGVLELKGGTRVTTTAPSGAARPPAAAPPTPGETVDIPKPEAETLSSEPAPQVAQPSPEEVKVRDDITSKHASLSDSTLYDLLGITMTANSAEIKKAYYAMAKKYHPDRHHSPHLQDVHGLLEELFAKITHAYQTLSAPIERRRYDSSVRTEAPRGTVSPVSSKTGGSESESSAAEEKAAAANRRRAEERYIEGKRHFDEMHYFDAIQCLRDAVRLNPKKTYHKLLAQALLKNPLWGKEAEEHFREALKLDHFDAECYLGLGEIYERAGMTTRAQKMYEQAASYDPESEAVQEKLGDKKGSSLAGIKKIFGRRGNKE